MTEALVELRNLSFAYGADPVLEEIDLTMRRGDYLGLIGPNGSGKTTLLKLILGALKAPYRGEIRLFGVPLAAFRDWWKIGYVAQKAASFNTGFPATVEEVVLTGRAARRGLLRPYTADDRRQATEALRQVDLWPLRDKLIGQLSGGQQQRVFIARALVSGPELLILDEPTVGVDAHAEGQFYALVRQLRKEMNLSVVLVSHDIGAVGHEVTSLACLNRKLFYHGSPDDFGSDEQMCELYGHQVRFVQHHHHHG